MNGNIGNLIIFIYCKKPHDRAKNLQSKNTIKIVKKNKTKQNTEGMTAEPRYSEGRLHVRTTYFCLTIYLLQGKK